MCIDNLRTWDAKGSRSCIHRRKKPGTVEFIKWQKSSRKASQELTQENSLIYHFPYQHFQGRPFQLGIKSLWSYAEKKEESRSWNLKIKHLYKTLGYSWLQEHKGIHNRTLTISSNANFFHSSLILAPSNRNKETGVTRSKNVWNLILGWKNCLHASFRMEAISTNSYQERHLRPYDATQRLLPGSPHCHLQSTSVDERIG